MQTNNMNLFLLPSLLLLLLLSLLSPLSAHNITAVLAFGDSTLDSGNNNFITTLVKANHTPYGQDFPGRIPTGRFSNGKLITDFLVSALGLKQTLPASSDPSLTVTDLLTGVSFASAGSGLDDLTATMSSVVSIGRQVAKFEEYLGRLREGVGGETADGVVRGAVIVIGAGSNDMMMNYYLTPVRRLTFSLDEYHEFLLQRLEDLVQSLYKMGGRKFAIAGLPPLGCLPLQITLASATQGSGPGSMLGPRVCVDQQNRDAVEYNSKLQVMIDRMGSLLNDTKFAYVDIYNPVMAMIQNPEKYGFVETTLGCCGTGIFEMGLACSVSFLSCGDPSKFLFWDSVHPSQATYQALADQMMQTVLTQIT